VKKESGKTHHSGNNNNNNNKIPQQQQIPQSKKTHLVYEKVQIA
jgi:hypothetical protein